MTAPSFVLSEDGGIFDHGARYAACVEELNEVLEQRDKADLTPGVYRKVLKSLVKRYPHSIVSADGMRC